MSRKKQKGPDCRVECESSDIIEAIPKACNDETAAVEFFELRRWGDTPCCPHCGETNVYKMTDRDGTRNKRFLWRCRGCAQQYTVRIGAVYEETRLPMRHWAYAMWRMATSKKGVSALEVKRQCQISYKSALFLLNRIRFAMAPDAATMPPLSGTVECDEVWIGGKPRKVAGVTEKRMGRSNSTKVPVFVAVQRDGNIRRRPVANVNGRTLRLAMRQVIDPASRIMTDEHAPYRRAASQFAGGHETVCHTAAEYVRGDVHTNTAESSNAIIKRSLMGIYHNVSKEYLHRYLWQWDFAWNTRKLTDGERVARLVHAADGKRLMYIDALPTEIERRG
jgi:transposase-like protein